MDAEELRRMLRGSGVDLWALLETAVAVAAADHAEELRARRDGIVERLYAPPAPLQKEEKGSSSPVMKTVHREEDEEDVEVNVEKRNVLAIKKSLEDADQVWLLVLQQSFLIQLNNKRDLSSFGVAIGGFSGRPLARPS